MKIPIPQAKPVLFEEMKFVVFALNKSDKVFILAGHFLTDIKIEILSEKDFLILEERLF